MIIGKMVDGRVLPEHPEKQREVVQILREAETLCTVISDSTRLPYVECDKETYDDEILVFDSEKEVKCAAEALRETGCPVRIMNIPKKQRLAFFSSLFSMGVNAILLNKGTDKEYLLELEAVVRRPELPRFSVEIGEKLKKGEKPQFRIENPEFHLTAIYFTQKARSRQADQCAEEIKELQEEMMIHYREGFYIAARTEDGGMPLIKRKDGGSLQPLFTDMQEFVKFQHVNAGTKIKTFVVTEGEFLKYLAKDAAGIVVNPFGISLVLQVNRNQKTSVNGNT